VSIFCKHSAAFKSRIHHKIAAQGTKKTHKNRKNGEKGFLGQTNAASVKKLPHPTEQSRTKEPKIWDKTFVRQTNAASVKKHAA
jgi:hypothetical protein